MKELKINLNNRKGLATLFYSRPMFYALNTFGKTSIDEIKIQHCKIGFVKCMLSEEAREGILYMIYDSDGYFMDVPKKDAWEFFHDSVLKSKHFIETVQLSETRYAFKLKFPEHLLEDYFHLLDGKYSKVSEDYMLDYYPQENSLLYNIYYKTPAIRYAYSQEFGIKESVFDTCELGPVMDIEEETLKLSANLTF